MDISFKEEQRLTPKWLRIILVAIAMLPVYGIYKQIFNKEPIGENPMSDGGLILFSIFMFCFIALFWFISLKTEMDKTGIRMIFFPFSKKRVSWEQIKSAEIVNYGFVGGWGIRFTAKYGTVYNTWGKMGLAIELKNGRKFLIGTQKVDELSEFLKSKTV